MTSVYYDDELKLLWKETEHSSIYETNVIHGENCDCCKKGMIRRTWTKKEKEKEKGRGKK
jgi:hypothetical protein